MDKAPQTQAPVKKLNKPKYGKVKDLKPGVHGFNVYLKIVSLEEVQDLKRADGTSIPQIVALGGDETGVVRIRLLGENSKLLEKGKIVAVRNGRSEVFREKMRLEVDKWGKVTGEPDAQIGDVLMSNNLSEVLYETKLVKVDNRPPVAAGRT